MNNLLSAKETKTVLDILVEQLGVHEGQLTHDARIMQDFNADSLTVMEITLAVEERFDVSIPDEMVERVSTVGDLLETVADVLRTPERGFYQTRSSPD